MKVLPIVQELEELLKAHGWVIRYEGTQFPDQRGADASEFAVPYIAGVVLGSLMRGESSLTGADEYMTLVDRAKAVMGQLDSVLVQHRITDIAISDTSPHEPTKSPSQEKSS